MAFLVVSFLAGALTVLAPCILPLLPVVIGASASGRSKFTPFIVVGSLSLSILVFTYLLKASTALITIPPYVWTYLSGGILFFFGLTLLFPSLWERIPGIAKLSALSNKAVGSGYKKKTVWGDALIGAALGPVFSTCSPTYFVILASVLPASFLLGTTYLLAYIAGLALVLLLIAFLGQSFADRLTGISDSKGWLKRGFGVLFIVLGLMIATGIEKKIETAILESGYFDVTKIEQQLLQWVPDDTSSHETNPMNKEAGTP
jgi:cytochrome c biogenesis protein CcdA